MKYIKPKSLTWWASFTPLCLGGFMAAEPVHGLVEYVDTISNVTDLSPATLINGGLAGIGLRAAVDDA